MARIHLFEFEDQQWFPGLLRNYVTDFLLFLSIKAGVYHNIISVLEDTLRQSRTATIIDLGSGSGGGLIGLNNELRARIPALQIILTDYYPNSRAIQQTKKYGNNIRYEKEPVDARNVPRHLKGLRTMFLSFHHFTPSDAGKILQNAIDSNNSLAIFESQERSAQSILAMILSPLSVLLTTPFIRPFQIGRVLFTYLIPVVPLVVLWDGIVSSLRTYSVQEMNELINSLEGKEHFEWTVGKVKSGPAKILFTVGIPKKHQETK